MNFTNDMETDEEIQCSDEDHYFDQVIGHIEDIFMEDTFQELQSQFMEKYWKEFDDGDENKLSYMTIFKEYTDVIEKHIEMVLAKSIPNFSMESFIKHLQEQKDNLEGEVFEMLHTFADFVAFKEMFLDYKAVKEGTVEDLGKHISITSIS